MNWWVLNYFSWSFVINMTLHPMSHRYKYRSRYFNFVPILNIQIRFIPLEPLIHIYIRFVLLVAFIHIHIRFILLEPLICIQIRLAYMKLLLCIQIRLVPLMDHYFVHKRFSLLEVLSPLMNYANELVLNY